MFKITEIHIENFKNLQSVKLGFDSRFICFTGENGAGKTNMLDAIYYTSMGKSYFPGNDLKNIRDGENYFTIRQVNIINDQKTEVFVALSSGNKKKIKANQEEYERLADHIGRFPLVMVTPDDIELIDKSSNDRRRFLDRLISQTNADYLKYLIQYNRALQQRNAVLKRMTETGKKDFRLLEVYNQVLIQTSPLIYQLRRQYLTELNNLASHFYHQMVQKNEYIEHTYISVLHEQNTTVLLKKNEENDLMAGRTTSGIHRDDFKILINNKDAQIYASQGQKKSILLALKLAEFMLIKKHKNFRPVLLLDDLMDKLDENRFHNFLRLISTDEFGQVFITDTMYGRIKNGLSEVTDDYSFFEVRSGKINKKSIFES